MQHPFESREASAWVELPRVDQSIRVLSDPRIRVTRVGSSDARVRRHLAERFAAEAFDDLRMLAVATEDVLWINRAAPLAEQEGEALVSEDIAIVAGSCTLPFLADVSQCETAPSFRRSQAGRALLGIREAFGRVDIFQATVAVTADEQLEEGLRVAVGAAIAVLGPIDQVMAFGMRQGGLTASVVGERGLGTLAVGSGLEATCFTMVGEGGIAIVASAHVAWRRRDGSWVEESRLSADGDEPIIQTILEAQKPVGTKRGRRAPDDSHRRMRLRIAAVADTLRLSSRTGQRESVDKMLHGFGIDPTSLLVAH